MKIALVTGATGFIGRHLVRRLLSENYKVRALTSGSSRESLAEVEGRIEWFPLDEKSIDLAAQGVTHFFNLAVVYDRPKFSDDEIYGVNVSLPLRVIAALEKNARPVSCVLGDTFYRKFLPDATSQPRYTVSKNLLARHIRSFPAGRHCRFAMLLIEQVYGPGESLEKAYPRVIRQLLKNIQRVPLTKGDQRRDFIHINDVVSAAVIAGDSEWEGVVDVGCGSGVSTPVRQVFECLKALSSSCSELGFGDIPSDQTIPDSVADTTWLRSRGWSDRVQLEEGLRDFVTDVRSRVSAQEGLQ